VILGGRQTMGVLRDTTRNGGSGKFTETISAICDQAVRITKIEEIFSVNRLKIRSIPPITNK
jgi:hypothetical protein